MWLNVRESTFAFILSLALFEGVVTRYHKGVTVARSLDPISHLLFAMIALVLFKVLMILQDGVVKILAL